MPIPSPADIGYTMFYPLMLGALAALVRTQAAGHMRAVWLDSVLGSLGAASVLAVLLNPVLDAASQGPPSAASIVSVAMPLFDLLLVATVVGIASSRTLDLGPRWTVLVLGLLVFAATDVVFALWVAKGTYQFGTPLNAGWAVGLGLVAVWVEGVARPGPATAPCLTSATRPGDSLSWATTSPDSPCWSWAPRCTSHCWRWCWPG